MSLLFVVKAVGVAASLLEAGYALVFHLEGDRRSARSLTATAIGVLIAALIGPKT